MKRFVLFLITLSLINASNAQDIKRALKQIEKGDYDKAAPVLQQQYNVNKYNVAACYGLGLVYGAPLFTQNDFFKAYELIQFAIRNHDKLKKDELNDMQEFLELDTMYAHFKIVDKQLSDLIKQKNDLQMADKFVSQCSESDYYQEILDLKTQLEFDKAKQLNTIESYSKFIESFPYSTQVAEARKLRSQVALDNAKSKNTVEAYREVLTKYGTVEDSSLTKQLLYDAALNDAKKKNTVDTYKEFIKKYPGTKQAIEAKKLLVTVAFADAQRINTVDVYIALALDYPANDMMPQITQSAYRAAVESNSTDAMSLFLANFPDFPQYNELFDKKAASLGESTVTDEIYKVVSTEYVKLFDNNQRKDRSSSISVASDGSIILGGYTEQLGTWTSDGWIIRLNASGNLLWEKKIATDGDDVVHDAVFTEQFEVVAVGHQNYSFKNRMTKVWIGKYDAMGKLIWEKMLDGTDAQAVAVHPSGNIVVAGYTAKSDGNRDLWLAQFDDKGNRKWLKTFENKGVARDVCVLPTGEIIVAAEYWIAKTDAQGNQLWESITPESTRIYSMILTSDNQIVVGGSYYDFKDYKKQETRSDFWVWKLNQLGKPLWDKRFDREQDHDIGQSIVANADGSFIVAGVSTTTSQDDVLIMKISAQGAKEWEKLYGSYDNEKWPQLGILPEGKILLFVSKGFNSDNILVKFGE